MTSSHQVPDPDRLGAVQRLFDIRTPFVAGAEYDAQFTAAVNEINLWHAERNEFFAALWKDAGEPVLDGIEDLARLPYVHASFFKKHEIRSVPAEDVALRLTSSGTTGQKSQVFLDAWSAAIMEELDTRTFDAFGWVDPSEQVNYLVYGYEPKPDFDNGATFGLGYVTDMAPVRAIRFGLRHTGTDHAFDPFGCVEALLRYAEEGIPVRILGFPAFLHFTLERMAELGVPPLRLPPRSLVFLGGGWKGHADRAVPKDELYASIREQLGVPDDRIREAYGSVEHPLPYYECARHHLHTTTWARMLVRATDTLDPQPWGEPGYAHFVSPFITSMPAHSIVMNDLVSLYPAEDCGCGLPTPWFTVHGRAGVSRSRSCAVAASELIKAGI